MQRPLAHNARLDHHEGLAIYIHWPFCASKCPYCDFNSHVRSAIDQELWKKSLIQDLQWHATMTPGRTVESIFFGGGTPSLMDPMVTHATIDKIHQLWDISHDLEVTLEANPSSVEASRFKSYKTAGVNRVSLGVQSFNDQNLSFLGRNHSAHEALDAITLARNTFNRISFDLMYSLPNQTSDQWRQELTTALTLAVDHLSLYQLTIEKNTKFYGDWRRNKLIMPDEDLQADTYELTQTVLQEKGFPAYEISNHALKGAECRHNLIYWRGGEWLGIGPGAHGRLNLPAGRTATQQWKNPEKWLAAITKHGHGMQSQEVLSNTIHAEEAIMMNLRLTEGMNLTHLAKKTNIPLEKMINLDVLNDLVQDNFLWQNDQTIGTTPKGSLVLNTLLSSLLTV